MEFLTYKDLSTEQREACENRWPKSEPALDRFEFNFHGDGTLPFARRMAPVAATGDKVQRQDKTAEGRLTCELCGTTGISAKGMGPHRRHCKARAEKANAGPGVPSVAETGSPAEVAARELRTGDRAWNASVEQHLQTFPGDRATIADISAGLAGDIQNIPLVCLEDSPTQPRTNYDTTKHEELVASMRARGWVKAFPAMVRVKPGPGFEAVPTNPNEPEGRWSIVHPETRALVAGNLAQAEAEQLAATKYARRYEIVFAHRRTRAARAAGLSDAPCVVSVLSDVEVLELQLIENVQRDDLSPVDEAEHLRRLLALRDDKGEPAHTRRTLADRVGKTEDHISKTLLLCRLQGDLRKSVAAGELGVAIAYELARIPDAEVRDAAAREILNPSEGEGPMRRKAAIDYIRRNCTRNLRGVKFPVDDPELVPVRHRFDESSPDGTARYFGGSCLDCPLNSANVGERTAHAPKLGVCGNVACFEAKSAADFERWRAQHNKPEAGKVALPAERNAEVFDDAGEINWRSGLVPLNSTPDAGLLKPDAVIEAGGEVKTWKELTAGKLGEVLIARHPSTGKKVEVVEIDKAKAAAELNEHRIFKTSKTPRIPHTAKGDQQHKEQTLATKRQQDLERGVEARLLFEIAGKAQAVGFLPAGAWLWLAEWVLGTAAPAAVQKVERRRDIKSGELADRMREMDSSELVGLVVEVVLADYYASSLDDAAHEGLSAFGLDLGEVVARVRADLERESPSPVVDAIVDHLSRPAETSEPASKPPREPEVETFDDETESGDTAPLLADEGQPPATFLAYLTTHAVKLGNLEPIVKPYDVADWLEALKSTSVVWVCPIGGVDNLDSATYAAREALSVGEGTITTAGVLAEFKTPSAPVPHTETAQEEVA